MRIVAGYYKCVEAHDEINEGDIAYVVEGSDGISVVFAGGDHYTYDFDEFEGRFELDPEGAQKVGQRIAEVMGEIDQTELSLTDLTNKMLGFSPHVEGDKWAGGGALVAGHSSRTPATIKKAVAEIRNTVAKTKKLLDAKRQELTSLIEARTTALELRVQEMNELVAKANETIWTVNLYMGKNEEIHRLAEGEPAPANTPISLRQRVLYMDEECADIKVDKQGIDVQQIYVFDEWLLKDGHVDTLLPEPKGIVCFHVRSNEKKYDDPWVSAQLNHMNRRYTYFLIRNGENIYRIYADIVLGGVLFPDAGEYQDLFKKTEFDWETHKRETVVLKPGSAEYMKAMDRCEAKQRHYLRVLLVLQGLLDRTDIFKPLPVERINICNKSDYFEFLNFVYDTGEAVLDDGKPSFLQWIDSVNKDLDIGHRVVGAWRMGGLHGSVDGRSRYGVRVHPENSNTPNEKEVYTIVRSEPKGRYESHDKYFFMYDRGEIWDRWEGYRQSQTRASCYIYRCDRFFIDFDAARIEDIKYYLNSRKGKKEYQYMVPIMQLALKLKREEELDEEPFRLLLAGQIAKEHSVSLDDAKEATAELVDWWKLKNRTHRALTSDDKKAYDMILAEYGIRRKREVERAALALRHENVVQAIRQHEEPILVAHKSKNKYVAYVAENCENVWVKEQTWTLNRATGAVYMNDEKEWKLVDKRHERWQIVYKTERWDSWVINPRMATVLTDPEINDLIERAFDKLEERFNEEVYGNKKKRNFLGLGDNRNRQRKQRFWRLVGGVSPKGDIWVWFSDEGPILPKDRLFTRKPQPPKVYHCIVHWTRKVDHITCSPQQQSAESGTSWDGVQRDKRYTSPTYRLMYQDHGNLRRVADERQKAHDLNAKREELIKSVEHVGDAAQKYYHDKQEQAYFAEFLADHGDMDLWPDHLAELKFRTLHEYQVEVACCLLVERGIDVVGMTLGEVIDKALPWGLLEKRESRRRRRGWSGEFDKVDEDIPREFVVPPKEEAEEEEEEDEVLVEHDWDD